MHSDISVVRTDKQGRHTTNLASDTFLSRRTIWITGKIDAETAREVIDQLAYLDAVSAEDITVRLFSGGGAVDAGLAILDAMRTCRCDIVTIATGHAASMAAFLAAVGGTKGKRYISRHCEMMLHQPLGEVSGSASAIVRAAAHISRVRTILNTHLAEATGQTVTQIEADTAHEDRYFTAEEAVAYGLADHIL